VRSAAGPRTRRVLASITTALGAMFVVTQTVFAAVVWASPSIVGAAHTFNDSQSLARSTTPTTSYLHSVVVNSYPGGVAATDTGPYAGVYYSRGNSSGTTWETPKRLNPSAKHGTSPAIVANGAIIYAAYVLIGHWIDYDPAESRKVVVRINSNHGASSAWLTRTVILPTNRVDRPAMSVWGSAGFLLTYTDADTGDIVVISCGDLTVEDSGCSGGAVGTTTRLAADPADGYEGMPVVAASGETAAVAWLSGDSGITVRTGSPGSWSTPKVITTEVADGLSAAARGSRFAFSWAQSSGVKVRFWTGGVWQSSRTVATVSSTATYKNAYTTAVALAGGSTVGVAFAACRRLDCTATSTIGVDLRWRDSPDNGATWNAAVTVASSTVNSGRRFNDFPSVVMSSTAKRFVMYNTMSASGASYRVWLRVGTG